VLAVAVVQNAGLRHSYFSTYGTEPMLTARVDLVPLLIAGRRLLLAVTLAYVFASLVFGGTPAARVVFLTSTAGLGVLILVGTCRSISSTRPEQRSRLRKLLALFELLGVNVALTLVLGEVTLRSFAACTGHSWLLQDSLDAYRLQPGRDYGFGLRGNALGFPGPEFERRKQQGLLRIAAVGDSFAVGPAVAFDDNYLTLLGRALPHMEVYNFGVSGTGPREYRLILNQHVWDYDPDLVLVSIFAGNDITEWLATPRQMDPRQSALYAFLHRGWRMLREQSRQSRCNAEPADRIRTTGLSPETFREIEGRRLAICLAEPSPSLEKKWRRALGYLEQMIEDCRCRQAPIAIVLIPDEFQVNPGVLAEALDAARLSRSDVDLALPQRRLRAFCAERDVPCLDLLPIFAGKTDTYAPRDTHWNKQGNHLAARSLAAWPAITQLVSSPRPPVP
jgi:GDSL-like Lipase/Acylhydrolase family